MTRTKDIYRVAQALVDAFVARHATPPAMVTSLAERAPALPYRDLYCARGQNENFIKAIRNDLGSDRCLRPWLGVAHNANPAGSGDVRRATPARTPEKRPPATVRGVPNPRSSPPAAGRWSELAQNLALSSAERWAKAAPRGVWGGL